MEKITRGWGGGKNPISGNIITTKGSVTDAVIELTETYPQVIKVTPKVKMQTATATG